MNPDRWITLALAAISGLALYFSTVGGQNEKIAVLYERTGSLGGQFTEMTKSLDLVRQETVAHFVRIIEILVTGRVKDASYIQTQTDSDIEALKNQLSKALPLKTPQSANEEARILQQLEKFATKEKAGKLTEEEAVYMGQLGDRLSQLKQQQILESLRRSHSKIDCDICKKICGPYI